MNQLQQKEHMYRCIELAKNGIHTCKPNPRVGCVIVKDEKIIGEGWHKKTGGDHAEIMALKNCEVNPEGSVVFISLEPCTHKGRTAPCIEALIDAKVSKVIPREPAEMPDAGPEEFDDKLEDDED